MDVIGQSAALVDLILVSPYRWPGNPLAGWWAGTFILAMWSTLLGEITFAIAFQANKSLIRRIFRKMGDHHKQSINALKAGNKEAYKSINGLANEAFGRAFFIQIAMAAASLWPVPLALAWLETRFSAVQFPLPFDLPLLGSSVGYAFIFIPLYILVRIAFQKMRTLLILFADSYENQN